MVGAWGGYQNGKIPQKNPPLVRMVSTNPNSWCHVAAAHQFGRMDDACFKATGYRIGVVECYRELGTSADRRIRTESKTSTGSSNQWYQQGREDRGETTAATPGTSNHGWALAIDIAHYYVPAVWNWMTENAAKFGWSWATGKASGERWHWEYVGTLSLSALGIESLEERHTAMSATAPIRYTAAGKVTWARKRGDGATAVIEKTTSQPLASQWVADVGVGSKDYTKAASTATATLTRWATEIATDKTAYAALHADVILDLDEEAIAAQILRGLHLEAIFDATDAELVADAVVDEQAKRLES